MEKLAMVWSAVFNEPIVFTWIRVRTGTIGRKLADSPEILYEPIDNRLNPEGQYLREA